MPRCSSTPQHAWQPLLLPAGHTPLCKLTAWQPITPHTSSASTCSLLLYSISCVLGGAFSGESFWEGTAAPAVPEPGGSLLVRTHPSGSMFVQAELQQGTGQRTLQDVEADMEDAEASRAEHEGKRDQLIQRRDRMR